MEKPPAYNHMISRPLWRDLKEYREHFSRQPNLAIQRPVRYRVRMHEQQFFIYIVASIRGVLYTGMTRDIATRVEQHRRGAARGFSAKYRTTKLVWCETAESFESAREREAQLKRWRRSKKIWLIERENPYWEDISARVV